MDGSGDGRLKSRRQTPGSVCVSGVPSRPPPVRWHQSVVTSHQTPDTSHQSPVTCHLSTTPNVAK
ncbi:hypothetical protein [Sphaerospermopsis reniformis]|uniref:hypothetical protein n=1 Tax=Sphaerospermopsis reniformis TaxID=531300 RepID=UPI0013968372|nr:hypothetical protein [Sphaerospermopsis reniformis]